MEKNQKIIRKAVRAWSFFIFYFLFFIQNSSSDIEIGAFRADILFSLTLGK